jgi:hypothetical protein
MRHRSPLKGTRNFSAAELTAFVGVAVVAGVALRVWSLVDPGLATPDADEAVWGLMARHALHGQLSAFFWGQNYGGTHEVLLAAPLFWIFGPSYTALRIVPILLFAVGALLVWRIGRRLLGAERGRLAGALFWTWPAYGVWKSTRAHGFYGAGLVLGLAVVLLVLRLRERASKRDAAALGVALGLGVWATPEAAILALPALVWLVARRPRFVRETAPIALPLAVVAALPWLLSNVNHHGWSFHFPHDSSTGLPRLKRLVAATLPAALGVRVPFSLAWVGGGVVGRLLYVGAVAVLAAALAARGRKLGPLPLAFVVYPILYAVAPYAGTSDDPRYLVLFLPVLALMFAAVPGRPAVALVALAAVALSAIGIVEMDRGRLALVRADGTTVPNDLRPLIGALERRHIHRVFANYWIAYRLEFESNERILVMPTGQVKYANRSGRLVPVEQDFGREPAQGRLVAASPQAADVFLADGDALPVGEPLLARAGYRRLTVPGFVVFMAPAR